MSEVHVPLYGGPRRGRGVFLTSVVQGCLAHRKQPPLRITKGPYAKAYCRVLGGGLGLFLISEVPLHRRITRQALCLACSAYVNTFNLYTLFQSKLHVYFNFTIKCCFTW